MSSGSEFLSSYSIFALAFVAFFLGSMYFVSQIPFMEAHEKHVVAISIVMGVIGSLLMGYAGI